MLAPFIKHIASCRCFSWVTLAMLAVSPAKAQASVLEFTPDRWVLNNAEVKEHLGRKALEGSAYLKDVVFENGIIEVDIATEHKRSYPGILFRIQSEDAFENVYFRPHRAGHYSDAIQYVPVFNGVSGWQFYSGDGFTAEVSLPASRWVHVRMEVMGTQARVFVGESLNVNTEDSHGLGQGQPDSL